MASDSHAALVALNRFGFGARGAASGDLTNAASDPRGFVKADLNRAGGVMLEMPGLQPTPALAQAVFAYQDEVKRARETAAKSDAAASDAMPPATDAKLRRDPLLDGATTETSGKTPVMEMSEKANANAPMPATDAMQPTAAKPQIQQPAQPLNVIQKTFRAEALARLQRAMIAVIEIQIFDRDFRFVDVRRGAGLNAAAKPLGLFGCGTHTILTSRPGAGPGR